MNNKKTGIIIFIFLLIINSANAFDLTSGEIEKSVCPSSTTILNANVLGSGNFNINLEGSASKWATVIPTGFTLNNEAKTIYIYVTPNFDANSGLYDLNLIANSNNEVKDINYKINIPDCHNLVISGLESNNVCGCNSEVYNFTISNNGIYQESYIIEIKGEAAQWMRLNQNSLSLNPGQHKTIYAFFDAPCGGDFGEKDFSVTVRSLTSNSVASFDSNIIVDSCFDFNAKAEKEFINMCEHTSEIIPIKIDNLAGLDNEFNLKITGPAWANLHSTSLNLKSKDSGFINLILAPDYKVEGDFDINVNVKSKQSKINKDINIKSSVRKCNDLSFELLNKEGNMCAGSIKIYEAALKNLGEFEKEFRIESNQGWIKINQTILTISSGQSKNIKLEFNPGENLTSNKYKINFRALALDSSRISSEDSFNLDLVSKQECYKPEISVKDLEVNADSSATVPIVIKNVGAETADYKIGLSGNANTFSQLNPSIIKINPGESEIVYLYVAPPYNIKPGNYKANVFVNLEGMGILDSKDIKINVNEGKIQNENKINLWQSLINYIKKFDINQSKPEEIINLDKENLIKKNVKFRFSNEIHSLKILGVKNNTVTLSIESDPIIVLLDLNETKKIDLNNDRIDDITLSLEGFDENKNPLIKISSNKMQEKNELGLSYIKDKIYKYRFFLLFGLIILIGIILMFVTNSHKKLINYLEKEDDEENPLKIGRYILLILILGVLIWYYKDYFNKINVLFEYLNFYKFYIIAGLIILILLILILNYWKDIVDFFEEDVEEKKAKK